MMAPGPLPRVLCPLCRQSVPQRVNGALREHRTGPYKRGVSRPEICMASGLAPAAVDELAALTPEQRRAKFGPADL